MRILRSCMWNPRRHPFWGEEKVSHCQLLLLIKLQLIKNRDTENNEWMNLWKRNFQSQTPVVETNQSIKVPSRNVLSRGANKVSMKYKFYNNYNMFNSCVCVQWVKTDINSFTHRVVGGYLKLFLKCSSHRLLDGQALLPEPQIILGRLLQCGIFFTSY